MDLILSSGFLAFARHVGVIQAIEERGIAINGVCGTSSGAMIGSMWAAGHSVDFIRKEANLPRPIVRVRPSFFLWRGACGKRSKRASSLSTLTAKNSHRAAHTVVHGAGVKPSPMRACSRRIVPESAKV